MILANQENLSDSVGLIPQSSGDTSSNTADKQITARLKDVLNRVGVFGVFHDEL